MKKVKIMLASIGILAVIGGAFAFKAKKAFESNVFYSTVTTTYVGRTCPFPALTVTEGSVFATSYYYTIDPNGAACISNKITFTTPD